MKSNELRIGNFVLYNTYHDYIGAKNIKDKVINIESISNNGVNLEISNYSHCPENYWIPFENITPVTLTEEWLIKLGFELWTTLKTYSIYTIELDNRYTLTLYVYSNKTNIYLFENFGCEDDDADSIKLGEYENYYVHQLQNIYFSLNNKELVLV